MPRSGGTSNLSMSHLVVTGSTLRSRPHHHQTQGQHANTKVWRRDSARLTFGLGQKPQLRKVRAKRSLIRRQHLVTEKEEVESLSVRNQARGEGASPLAPGKCELSASARRMTCASQLGRIP